MSWIRNSCLSCFQNDKRTNKGCECTKRNCSKSEVADKNIQCNFHQETDEERVKNLVCDDQGQ